MIRMANDWCPEFKPNANSHGNPVLGWIGEIIFYDRYKRDGFVRNTTNNKDYDFELDGIRVDVKTESWPTPLFSHYHWNIRSAQLYHDVDYFYFIHLIRKTKDDWTPSTSWSYQLGGWISRTDYIELSEPYRTDVNDREPRVAIQHKQLNQIQKQYNVKWTY